MTGYSAPVMAEPRFCESCSRGLPGLVAAVFLALWLPGCGAGQPGAVENPGGAASTGAGSGSEGDTPEAEPEPADPRPVERGKAVIQTTEGPLTITFFPEAAPRTVAHLAALMKAGCYQGVKVFRYEPDFVVQVSSVSNGECHPDAMKTVPGEFEGAKHERFALSMARFEDPDSGTSSWSIMLGEVPSMDGQYTVFGRMVDGETTIRAIEAIGSTRGDDGMSRLDRPVTIETIQWLEPVEPGE